MLQYLSLENALGWGSTKTLQMQGLYCVDLLACHFSHIKLIVIKSTVKVGKHTEGNHFICSL